MKTFRLMVAGCCLLAARAHAATYYVTVAGLGGEPDYEQRFTANAMDLDKIFKSTAGAHVVTLTGKQATKPSSPKPSQASRARPGPRTTSSLPSSATAAMMARSTNSTSSAPTYPRPTLPPSATRFPPSVNSSSILQAPAAAQSRRWSL
jgi:hypothetical protein